MGKLQLGTGYEKRQSTVMAEERQSTVMAGKMDALLRSV